ncbi:hypothetical protein N9W79_01405, partial [bacterium]|nr:hypothetical protein [bacterium]
KVAAGFAHEINNPLAIADGHAHQLSQVESGVKFDEKLEMIEEAHSRISGIITKFLSIFATRGIQPGNFNIKKTIESSLVKAKLMDSTININVDPDLNVFSNRAIFNQLIEIINSNALEAVKDVKEPSVSWQVEGNSVLKCIDNGAGFLITFSEAEKPFVTTNKRNYGKGLGLFTAKLLCEKVDAKITYELIENHTVVKILFKYEFIKSNERVLKLVS